MELSKVENVPTPCGSILNLFRGSQLKSGAKSKNWSKFIKNHDFPYFPPCWGPLFPPLGRCGTIYTGPDGFLTKIKVADVKIKALPAAKWAGWLGGR